MQLILLDYPLNFKSLAICNNNYACLIYITVKSPYKKLATLLRLGLAVYVIISTVFEREVAIPRSTHTANHFWLIF